MTTRIVAQIHLPDQPAEAATRDFRATLAQALCETPGKLDGVVASHAGVHVPLSVGGGALSWDLLLADETAVEAFCARLAGSGPDRFLAELGLDLPAPAVAGVRVEAAIPETIAGELARPGLVGVKRTLWLRVEPEAEASAVARFEAETPLLAKAVPAIRNWCWSRVRTRAPRPMQTRWTHLWEQEFESLAGLETDYMSSPCHWGYVDRWFDPEMPERVVDLWLAHLACPETQAVLSWEAGR